MIDGPQAFAKTFQVSPETIARLETYHTNLLKWQNTINLIAPSTRDHIWHRHFADSAQLVDHLPSSAQTIIDVGSGGGFPGLVLAILFAEARPTATVTLVESDHRKAAFLRETARLVEIAVEILSTRIESDATVSQYKDVDAVTARACAPLDRLFGLIAPVFGTHTSGIFLKGQDAAREIEDAQAHWQFRVVLHTSVTDPSGQIAVVHQLARH